MAIFRITNQIIEEYTSIVEADSLDEAFDKFYSNETPVADLGQTEQPYDERGNSYEIMQEDIDAYCSEHEKSQEDLTEEDWREMLWG